MKRNTGRRRKLPRNILVRRLVTSSVALLMIAFLVWGVSSVFQRIGGIRSDVQQSANAQSLNGQSVSSRSSQSTQYRPCLRDDLEVHFSADKTVSSSGKDITFTFDVTNRGTNPCLAHKGEMTLNILRGNNTIVDDTKCLNDNRLDVPLLFGEKMNWSGKLTWNGLQYKDCSDKGGGEPITAGEYRARLFYDGKPWAKDDIVITVP